MKLKTLSLFLLILILASVLVNAAANFSISSTTPADLTKTNIETTFTITNRGPETVNIALTLPATISDGKGHEIAITSSSALVFNSVAPNQNTGEIKVSYTGDITNFKIGEFTNNIVARAEQVGNPTNSLTLNVPIKFVNTFCKSGENASDLSISSIRIDNSDGDDAEWTPLDEITIKVKAENLGIERIASVYVELGLIDPDGKNVIKNMDNLKDRKISLGTISEDKEKTAEFTFKVPIDFKEGDHMLVAKAYKSGKEAEICTSFSSDFDSRYYQIISGERETDAEKQVVLDNIVLSPEETAQCGDKVQVSAEVVNIGDEDYLDQIKVVAINKELGVNVEKVIREDLDIGDSINTDFEFDIPAKAAEKTYTIEFRVYYGYDDSSSTYEFASSNLFSKTLKVQGNCKVETPVPQLQISAELDPETPEATAGKQVIITSTLKNTGDSTQTYSLSVSGNSPWSSLVSIDPQNLILNKGESKDVSIVLSLDQQAEGEKEFKIKANSGNQSFEQPVALSITKPTTNLSGLSEHLRRNWFIYVIIAVNVILLIAIIMVIRGMVSSPRRDFE